MKYATVHEYRGCTVVEITAASLLDAGELDEFGKGLYELVDLQDHRRMVLDFTRVTYVSSRAIGILVNMHNKIKALPKGLLVLCGVGPRVAELLKITRLDRLLTLRPTQRDAIGYFGRFG